MKRLYMDGLLSVIWVVIGYFYGAADAHKVFSSMAFQVAFGIVSGALAATIIGGGVISAIDRRHFNEMKKRVRVSMDGGKTSITIEPK